MRAPERLLSLAIASALLVAFAAGVAAAPDRSFGQLVAQMSPNDREGVQRTQREVLENMQPGAVAAWKDDASGHSGEAHLLKTYQRNGMMCADVEHILKVTVTSRYVLPLCRIGDGTWKLAY